MLDDGEPVDPWDRELPEGAAVVLGPEDADEERVRAARDELNTLVAAGGVVIAGAGVDLGYGFVSARLSGASGDRRDAVLAAMRVLGTDGAERLGDRAATLVALFGVTATKPVGAAAESAIQAQAWAALRLASAAADLLGPEQLERVLALRSPEGVDPIPSGAPSELAANLRQVLERYSGRRRLELILDLWEQVCDRQVRVQRQERLLGRQDPSVLDGLRERYRRHDDELETEYVRHGLAYGEQASPSRLARFVPTWGNFWRFAVSKLVEDAIAATVLLRVAMAVEEWGVDAGIERLRTQLEAASAMVTKSAVKAALRPVDGLSALPARPICHIRELDRRIRQRTPRDAGFERAVRERLATALPYAIVVHEACEEMFCRTLPNDTLPLVWEFDVLKDWRTVAGYTDVRPPSHWRQRPVVRGGNVSSLADRLEQDPAASEDASDLLWYADLADAIAQLRGLPAAEIEHTPGDFHFNANQTAPEPDTLTPRPDSIPLAVAGTAQLLSWGAEAPARCRSWVELLTALMAGGAIAEALTSEFEVPEAMLAEDGQTLSGTTARLEIARNARRLAEWSDYMGNCIAGPWYQDAAREGRSVLVALRDGEGRLLVNAELRTTSAGWRVNEIRGRFNEDPDPVLSKAFRQWVSSRQWTDEETTADDPVSAEPPTPPVRRRPASSPLRDIGPRLRELSRESFSHNHTDLAVLTALAEGDHANRTAAGRGGAASPDAPGRRGDVVRNPPRRGGAAPHLREDPDAPDPTAAGLGGDADPKALTALRRATADELTRLCVEALEARRVTLPALWSATAARPMAAAVAALNPAARERYPRLHQLTEDAPLASKSLRLLVKDPDLAPSRSMDIVALRLRRALGRLALDGNPTLSRALLRDPHIDLLCPLILAITCAVPKSTPTVAITGPREVTVPGFPASSLADEAGPWQRAWPAATEIGFDRERFWDQIADTGLLAPAAWITSGWPTLWQRAAERTPNPQVT